MKLELNENTHTNMTIRRVGNVLLFLMITVVGWGQHTDPRTRTYIAPTRIVWQYNGSGGLIHNINALLKGLQRLYIVVSVLHVLTY